MQNDDRLEKSLLVTESGKRLYQKIYESTPVICLSNSYVGNPRATEGVQLLPLEENQHDFQVMFDVINEKVETASEKTGWLEYLEFLNEVVVLQPNIAGLGVNFNVALKSYIEKLKAR